jgi:hypothetical protein
MSQCGMAPNFDSPGAPGAARSIWQPPPVPHGPARPETSRQPHRRHPSLVRCSPGLGHNGWASVIPWLRRPRAALRLRITVIGIPPRRRAPCGRIAPGDGEGEARAWAADRGCACWRSGDTTANKWRQNPRRHRYLERAVLGLAKARRHPEAGIASLRAMVDSR